ncbi:MAG: CopD family protein [Gammaproteobacteria bacterium]
MLPDVASVVVRALSFICALQAAGAALFLAAFGRVLVAATATIQKFGIRSALAAMVLVSLHYGLEAARMAGDLAGVTDLSLQKLVLSSTTSEAAAVRLLGLVLIAFGLRGQQRMLQVCSVTGAFLVALSFALMGHTSDSPEHWLLAAMLVIHLVVIEFWLGALVPLHVLSARETPARAATVIGGFTAVATLVVPAIFVAGLVMALALIPSLSVLREPYGALILVKAGGFAVLMALAAANKLRFGPAIARGDASATRRFRQTVGAEYVVIVAVLAATAIMTSFYSPEG